MSIAGAVKAEHKVLFVHGKNALYCYNGTLDKCYKDGDYNATYWGDSVGAGQHISAFYVGYNATEDPRAWGLYVNGFRLSDGVYTGDGPYWNRAQSQLHAALWWGAHPTYGGAACWGDNHCTLACHSAGCYVIDYYFAHYDPSWDSLGLGALNVYNTLAVSSASGGSELANGRTGWSGDVAKVFCEADTCSWAGDARYWPMTIALETSRARGFNHDATYGKSTWHMAGRDSNPNGWLTDNYFGVYNDGAVAFHSQCGYHDLISTNICNDADVKKNNGYGLGECRAWSGCPWYNPFCTRRCTNFYVYRHWANHYTFSYDYLADLGLSAGLGWDNQSKSYDKNHPRMKAVLGKFLLRWFGGRY